MRKEELIENIESFDGVVVVSEDAEIVLDGKFTAQDLYDLFVLVKQLEEKV